MADLILGSGDVIKVEQHGIVHGQKVMNTWHWLLGTVPPGFGMEDLLSGINTEFINTYLDCLSAEYQTDSLWGRRLNNVPSRGYLFDNSGRPGAVSGEALPPSVAGVISRYGFGPGPSWRGRIFLPAVPVTFHNDGLLNVTGQAAYGGLAPIMAMRVTIGTGPQQIPILYGAAGIAEIDRAKVQLILRNQNRRQVGVGI